MPKQRRNARTNAQRVPSVPYLNTLAVTSVANTQTGTTVYTAPTGVPTRVRIRAVRGVAQPNGAVSGDYVAILVRVPGGMNAASMALASGSNVYPDMRNLLAYSAGTGSGAGGAIFAPTPDRWTILQRNATLAPGDTIQIQFISTVAFVANFTADLRLFA